MMVSLLNTQRVSLALPSRHLPNFSPSPEFVNRCRGRVSSGLRSAAYGHDGYGVEHARDEGGGHAAADPDLDHQTERRRGEIRRPDPLGYGQSRPRRRQQSQYRSLSDFPADNPPARPHPRATASPLSLEEPRKRRLEG